MNRFAREEKNSPEVFDEDFPHNHPNNKNKSKEDIYLAVRRMHMELFPEEYSFMMDSHIDLKLRTGNKSPLKEDYLNLVNKRRAALGVSRFSGVNSGFCDDTWQFCRDKLGL